MDHADVRSHHAIRPRSRAKFIAMGEVATARKRFVVNTSGGVRFKFFGSASMLSTESSGKASKTRQRATHEGSVRELHRGMRRRGESPRSVEAIGGEILRVGVGCEALLGVVTSTVKLFKAVARDDCNLFKSDE